MIRDNAKKIVKYMLEQAITNGSLAEQFFIQYDTLANELDLESESLCRVCCQYLDQLKYIRIVNDNDGNRLVTLTAKGIDFLESI